MPAKRASQLEPGDLVDAETFGDYLAAGDAIAAEFEYWTVSGVEWESWACVRVDFENHDSYGLPPGLIVQLGPADD